MKIIVFYNGKRKKIFSYFFGFLKNGVNIGFFFIFFYFFGREVWLSQTPPPTKFCPGNVLRTIKSNSMLKAALLFVKTIQYTNKAGQPATLYVGTCITGNGSTVELVSSGPFAGSAVFYKEVKKGEEMWPGKVADADTNVLLGSNTLSNIKEAKASLDVLNEIEW